MKQRSRFSPLFASAKAALPKAQAHRVLYCAQACYEYSYGCFTHAANTEWGSTSCAHVLEAIATLNQATTRTGWMNVD
jgi:hypothetical protein